MKNGICVVACGVLVSCAAAGAPSTLKTDEPGGEEARSVGDLTPAGGVWPIVGRLAGARDAGVVSDSGDPAIAQEGVSAPTRALDENCGIRPTIIRFTSAAEAGAAASSGASADASTDVQTSTRATLSDLEADSGVGDGGAASTGGSLASDAPAFDAAASSTAVGDGGASVDGDVADVSPASATGLHAVGNSIQNANGEAVIVHGVNRSGSEFACVGGYGFFDGPADQASLSAMLSWNINAVRVPLNEDCWLGINGVSAAYSGANYQQAIATYVALIIANGMYPIVDLHWNAPGTTLATGQQPMADADHAPAFWTSVASTFGSNGSVILELYNEPWPDNDQDTDAAWKCWRDGGNCPSVPFEVAGMQTLVDTVRATGATNLLLLGGVEYSNALSQWVAHKPSDPLDNLAAAWHVYDGNACSDPTCYDQIAGSVASNFPIIATEIGDDACDAAFMSTIMGWLDSHGQSYAAWTWNAWGTACGNYSLISDYSGTPNGAYGLAFQTHLSGL
jgi:hypothetical protein